MSLARDPQMRPLGSAVVASHQCKGQAGSTSAASGDWPVRHRHPLPDGVAAVTMDTTATPGIAVRGRPVRG